MTGLTSARHGFPFLAAGQAQKELTHNEALVLVDMGLQACAVSIGTEIPPIAPLSGQCWILGPSPTGAWSDHPRALACWTDNGWRFLAPAEGFRAWVLDQQLWAEFVAGAWRIGKLVANAMEVNGHQVIGTRLDAISAPAGGTVMDFEARAAITAIIDRLATHGLIEA
jgi:hypothetical protein